MKKKCYFIRSKSSPLDDDDDDDTYLLAEACSELVGSGVNESNGRPKVSIHTGDVNNAQRMAEVMKEIHDTHGGIDVIVASAGISEPEEFYKISYETNRHVMDVNVLGTRNSIYAALPYLQKSGKGRIAMVSSLAGLWGFFGFTAYSVSEINVFCSLQNSLLTAVVIPSHRHQSLPCWVWHRHWSKK